MVHFVWGREEWHIRLWWGNVSERNHLEDLSVDGKVAAFRMNFKGMRAWTGLIWLRIGTDGGLL